MASRNGGRNATATTGRARRRRKVLRSSSMSMAPTWRRHTGMPVVWAPVVGVMAGTLISRAPRRHRADQVLVDRLHVVVGGQHRLDVDGALARDLVEQQIEA